MHVEPPWWEWLLAPSPELKRMGADPLLRMAKTGHHRPFPASWARSIGLWAVRDASDILAAVCRGRQVDLARARMSYDVFKPRNKLWSARQLGRQEGLCGGEVYEYGRVRVATLVHARINLIKEHDPAMSLGAAASLAIKHTPTQGKPENDPIGILPIEALRYYLAIEHLLEETGLSLRKWLEDPDSLRAWEWRRLKWDTLDCDAFVQLPAEALHKYDPGRHEED